MSRLIASNRLIVSGLFALVVATAPPALPQTARSPRVDSIDARKRAVRMQTWFERVRHMNLPVRFSGGGGNYDCDARIGRFCQWNDDDPRAPKEPQPISEARDQLLRTLESAAARSPGDDWIAGQRIRYLVEAGRDSDAVQVARSCAGTRWWCDALRGLTLHELGEYAAADTAFHDALNTMPAKERCRWTDLSILLDDAQQKRFGKVGCGRNEALAQRLWWLADPFLAIPGNDRETEHYARQVMNRILDGTRAGYSVQWGDDLRELVVRYGWSRYWSRAPGSSSFDPYDGPVSGHEAAPNYHFFPISVKVDSITDIGESTWDFRERRSVERYSPAVAVTFGDFNAQLALFRRGDSVQVVAAYDLTGDPVLAGHAAHTALVLQRNELEQPLISQSTDTRGWYTFTMNSTPRLLSFETWNPEKKRGARIRRGVWLPPLPANTVAVSDILLFDASTAPSTDLTSILPFALGPLTVQGTKKLGLYWETYGLARPDSALPVSLTLTRVNTGLRKLAAVIGLGKSTPMSIAWRETPVLGGIATRSVVLDLSLIPRGRYRLKLELTPRAGPPVTSTRVIEIL